MADGSLGRMPMEWVRVFEAAGRTGSFTAAAEEAGITQAAVSQRIRNLESRIGRALFLRQARGVTLTVDGEAWLPYVSQALNDLDRSAKELFAKPLRRLDIAASASVIQLWVTPRLKSLAAAGNEQISLSTMTLEGDYDRAGAPLEIRFGDGSWPERLSRRLFAEALQPLATPQLAAAVPDWREAPLIAIAGPRPGWREWARQAGQAAPPTPRYRFDSLVSALAAAQEGLGGFLGSLPLCRAALDSGQLVPLDPNILYPSHSYWLTADEKSLSTMQWNSLAEVLCAP
ncbi:MAG: LysR family transcriptional regulator [Pseudomonadota bacterium]